LTGCHGSFNTIGRWDFSRTGLQPILVTLQNSITLSSLSIQSKCDRTSDTFTQPLLQIRYITSLYKSLKLRPPTKSRDSMACIRVHLLISRANRWNKHKTITNVSFDGPTGGLYDVAWSTTSLTDRSNSTFTRRLMKSRCVVHGHPRPHHHHPLSVEIHQSLTTW